MPACAGMTSPSKDQVIVANFINKVGGAIYTKPEIKTPEDFRG